MDDKIESWLKENDEILRTHNENDFSVVLGRIKWRCKKHGVPYNLEEEDVQIPEYCPVLGIKLCQHTQDSRPEVDRIIPALGYVKGNVAVISHRANRIKDNGTLEEHELIVQYMKKHLT